MIGQNKKCCHLYSLETRCRIKRGNYNTLKPATNPSYDLYFLK